MTTHAATPGQFDLDTATTPHPELAAPPANPFFTGDPAALGIPVFVAGSVALAIALIGYVPASAVGAPIAIIAAATGLGLTIATIWAAAVGQSAVASVFGIFSGFWLSYAVLVLGLLHNWFAITADAAMHTQALFLITWLVIMSLLTLATLRLPLAFTGVFALVVLALIALLIGTVNDSSGWTKTGGVIVFLFAAIGAYIYYGVGSRMTGGPEIPLGRPVIH